MKLVARHVRESIQARELTILPSGADNAKCVHAYAEVFISSTDA